MEYSIHGRRIDGLVVVDESSSDKRIETKNPPKLADLAGKKVIIIQTKRNKLGMGLAGQTIVSRALLIQEHIDVLESVALCLEIDERILSVLKLYGCNAVVRDDSPNAKNP